MDVKVNILKFEHNVDQLENDTKKNDVKVLFINITNYSAKIQFTICCIAVFVLYVIYGFLQELIFTLEGFKPYGWYLTLVQFFLYTTFACVECTFTRTTTRRIPLRVYCLLAGLTLGTIGFSNASLSYLNYPTQVIFKCCKLIPVMFGSILIQKKKYKMIDFLACIFMSIGLSCFTLADSRISPNFSSFGVTLISCALLCDAIIGNVQEKSMKAYLATNVEVVFYSYAIGFVYLAIIMVLSGSLQTGYNFCSDVSFSQLILLNFYQFTMLEKPLVYFYALIFSMAGYLGVQVVLTLVKTCGALAAVTVTTCRKAVSIVISFLFFSKPFTMHYIWAGGLVVLGIYFSFLSKNNTESSNLRFLLNWIKFVTRRHYKKSLETTV